MDRAHLVGQVDQAVGEIDGPSAQMDDAGSDRKQPVTLDSRCLTCSISVCRARAIASSLWTGSRARPRDRGTVRGE